LSSSTPPVVSSRIGAVPTDVTPERRIATAALALMAIVVILADAIAAGVIVERKQE